MADRRACASGDTSGPPLLSLAGGATENTYPGPGERASSREDMSHWKERVPGLLILLLPVNPDLANKAPGASSCHGH